MCNDDLHGFVTLYSLFLDDIEGISDIGILNHIKCISIRNCPNIVVFPMPTTELQQTWSFDNCDINEYMLESFNNFYNLQLVNSQKLLQISRLEYLHYLEIDDCSNLTNITCLRNINCLVINCCDELKTISNLTSIEQLKIYSCKRLNKIHSLVNIHTVEVFNCNRLEDVSGLADSTIVILIEWKY